MYNKTEKGIIVPVKVSPKASKNQITSWEGEELKVRLSAVPEKGEANRELIRFFAKEFGITQANVIVLQGETSRHKKVLLENLPPESEEKLKNFPQKP